MKILVIIVLFYATYLTPAMLVPKYIPYPYYVTHEASENEVMSIDSGAPALELRLQIIRRAKKSIEVEYFCYNTDLASKIFTHELIKAAERGVKVRLLIDKAINVFVFDEYYARELISRGIELRYFNNASIFNFTKVIYRNHRKLLLVDGTEAITGGRNMGDEYFDMAKDLNYSDRDIYVKGPIVLPMLHSFDEYFKHEMSVKPEFPESTKNDKSLAAAEFLKISDKEIAVKERMAQLGAAELSKLKLHVCPVTTFASDAPGGGVRGIYSQAYADRYRFLRRILINKISQIDKSLLISTPYFLTNNDSRSLIENLLRDKTSVSIFTNSLTASDASYMSAHMYFTLKSWSKAGIQFYLHNGAWPGDQELLSDKVRKTKWSDHSKTHIYESKGHTEVMIGTFNMHNRSSFYDSEMAIFCRGNDEFTAEVKASIMKRAMKGIYIDQNQNAVDADGKPLSEYGPSEEKIDEMKMMTLPVWFLKFLL